MGNHQLLNDSKIYYYGTHFGINAQVERIRRARIDTNVLAIRERFIFEFPKLEIRKKNIIVKRKFTCTNDLERSPD